MTIEVLEMSCERPNMVPHILTHLHHIPCLLGHDDTTTAASTTPIDPTGVSLIDAPSNIDRTIESVVQSVVAIKSIELNFYTDLLDMTINLYVHFYQISFIERSDKRQFSII